jgi:CheY-like chemotaxis protein
MRKNIILAEDDEDDQMFFRDALQEISSEIDLQINDNGEELMSALTKECSLIPDIIFLDLNMPIKDGFTCLQEIRFNDKFKNCPVIILTTSNNPEHIELAYQFGANLFVSKPNNFYDLKITLNNIINGNLTNPLIIQS